MLTSYLWLFAIQSLERVISSLSTSCHCPLWLKLWQQNVCNENLGSGHQYTPMMEHVTYMVAIGTRNEQQRDADKDEVPCPLLDGIY